MENDEYTKAYQLEYLQRNCCIFHDISFGKPEKTFSSREMKVKSLLSILGEKQVPSFHASTPEHHIILLVEFIIVFVNIISVF